MTIVYCMPIYILILDKTLNPFKAPDRAPGWSYQLSDVQVNTTTKLQVLLRTTLGPRNT